MDYHHYKNLPVFFRYRTFWHILFWLAIYFGYVISYGGYGHGKYNWELVINLILLPVRVVFTYAMIYYLLPTFLLKRRFQAFTVTTLAHAFLFGTALWLHFYFFLNFPEYWCCYSDYPLFNMPKILVQIISNYGIVLFAIIIKLFKWWYIDQLYKSRLEKEKLESELNYLKSQIHPHFLFNTLNNLYALTLQKSERASDVVIKLSGLLDYMLYNSGADRIPVEKELDIINSYIELEKIRYDDRLNLKFAIEGETSSIEIAPLILFPFIENAFKHGASNDSKHPTIDIVVILNPSTLELRVRNSIPITNQQNKKNNSEGIGLNNVTRRLELIYPGQYKLDLKKQPDSYLVDLTINLIGNND